MVCNGGWKTKSTGNSKGTIKLRSNGVHGRKKIRKVSLKGNI